VMEPGLNVLEMLPGDGNGASHMVIQRKQVCRRAIHSVLVFECNT